MLNNLNQHLLDIPSAQGDICLICGKPASNHHHVIQKGMGGTKLAKRIPTVPLCGFGNNKMEGCHGLAHSGMLFIDHAPEAEHLKDREEGWYYCKTFATTSLLCAIETGEWLPCQFTMDK